MHPTFFWKCITISHIFDKKTDKKSTGILFQARSSCGQSTCASSIVITSCKITGKTEVIWFLSFYHKPHRYSKKLRRAKQENIIFTCLRHANIFFHSVKYASIFGVTYGNSTMDLGKYGRHLEFIINSFFSDFVVVLQYE